MGITRPLLTCDAVIAETLFLLRRGGIGPDDLLDLIARGLVVPKFNLAAEIAAIQQSIKTYRNIPMSLADACLVRMSEIHEDSKVMTLDSDFTVYRKSRRKVIPLICPSR
jgi:predicted nucleic acid-binding protein